MKRIFFLGLIVAGIALAALGQTNVLNEASRLELSGHFKEAATVLQKAISTGKSSPAELSTLEFELDRLKRIRSDFHLAHDQLYKDLATSLKDLTPAEFDDFARRGWFDGREIDGTMFY